MSEKENKADVIAALELAKEEIDKEAKRIFSVGGAALSAGNIEPAEKAIAYAKKLASFVKKVQGLGDEWKKLQTEIQSAEPEVREIVLPTKDHTRKVGYTRKVEKVAPKTNFTVTFPDGSVIAAKKAKVVFAKAIEKLGVVQVSSFKIIQAQEPLVSKDRSVYKKQPMQVESIKGGWFVKTHSSTEAKIQLLTKIAAKLGVKLTIKKI